MYEPDRPSLGHSTDSIQRLEFTVDWAPGHAAAYVLPGDEPILVDAGAPGPLGRQELCEGLDEYGLRPADIDHVLLTHAHTDHIGQVRSILEAGTATVYAPRHIRDRFQRDIETVATATRTNLIEAGVEADRLDDSSDHLVDIHRSIRELLPLDAVDVWIDEGEPIDIGDFRMDPIYTPGHQFSHFCYRTTVRDETILFSGDIAMAPFRAPAILVNFDDGVRDSVHAFFETLDRLEPYQIDRVFPGHGPVHTKYDDILDRSVTDLEEKLETCLETLEPNGSTAFHVVTERTGRKQGVERLLAEIVGTLSYLESQGRIRSTLDNGVRLYEPV